VSFSMHVTAASGGSSYIGIRLAVKVLTGAAAVQDGATAAQSCDFTAAAAHQATLVTTVTGSLVYGAIDSQSASAPAAASGTTVNSYYDSTTTEYLADCVTSSPTGTPGPVTVGASAPFSGGSCAIAEILPDGTLAEDPSAPAIAVTESDTTVTTADFTPPGGSLLVACVSAVSGTGVETMTVDGGGVTWTPLAEANHANGGYAGVWIAVAPTPGPDDPIITATQSGSSAFKGMALLVKVLTGAIEGGGVTAAGNSLAGAVAQASITPSATNSKPVFAISFDGSSAGFGAAATNNTYFDNAGDVTDLWSYAHGHYTGTVTSGTPVTVGAGTAIGDHSNWAVLELQPSGGSTPVVDASSPPLVQSDTLLSVSTANFTPPLGSVLVALVVAGGSASGTGITMTVSGGGLAWTQRVVSSASDNFQPCFIWTATVTGTGAAAPGLQPPEPPRYLPGKYPGAPFSEPFAPWPPWDQAGLAPAPPAAAAVPAPEQRPAITSRPRLRARLGPSGGSGGGIASPVVTPRGTPARPVPLVARGRLASRARCGPGGSCGAGLVPAAVTTAAVVQAQRRPVQFRPVPPGRAVTGPRRAAGGIASAVVTPLGSPPSPAQRPVIRHPLPRRAVTGPRQVAAGIASAVVTPLGTPGPQWRPQPRRPGPDRAAWHGAAGLAATVTVGATAYQRPVPRIQRPGPSRAVAGRGRCGGGQPGGANAALVVTPPAARPLPPSRVRPPRRGLWRGNASQVVTPLGTPVRRPGPVITGRPPRRASWRGNEGPPSPVVTPPPRCRPLAPRRRPQRAALRRGIGLANLVPPPFTVGALTAATASAALTASGATAPLTVTTASAALTATTRTGGPS